MLDPAELSWIYDSGGSFEGMKMDNFDGSQQCNVIPFYCIAWLLAFQFTWELTDVYFWFQMTYAIQHREFIIS